MEWEISHHERSMSTGLVGTPGGGLDKVNLEG